MFELVIRLAWSGLISVTLIGLGAYYLVREGRAWRRNGGYEGVPPADRTYFRRQFYRRFQGSILLVLAGIAIFIGLNVLEIKRSPRLYGCFWIAVLLGLLWMIYLSGADLIAIRRYARREEQRLDNERRELIAQDIAELRARNNGDAPVS